MMLLLNVILYKNLSNQSYHFSLVLCVLRLRFVTRAGQWLSTAGLDKKEDFTNTEHGKYYRNKVPLAVQKHAKTTKIRSA